MGGGDFINDKTSGLRNLVENGNELVEWENVSTRGEQEADVFGWGQSGCADVPRQNVIKQVLPAR